MIINNFGQIFTVPCVSLTNLVPPNKSLKKIKKGFKRVAPSRCDEWPSVRMACGSNDKSCEGSVQNS